MPELERKGLYARLLKGPNQEFLTEVATPIIRNVLGDASRMGLIEEDGEGPPSFRELTEVRDWFRNTRFQARSVTGKTRVRFSQIGRLRGKKGRGLAGLARRRCECIPSLYEVLVDHRNVWAHEHEDDGSRAQVVGLCGVVMSVLDLSTGLDVEQVEGVIRECDEALALVVRDAIDDREEDLREANEATDAVEGGRRPKDGLTEAVAGRETGEEAASEDGRLQDALMSRIDETLKEMSSGLSEIGHLREEIVSANRLAAGVGEKVDALAVAVRVESEERDEEPEDQGEYLEREEAVNEGAGSPLTVAMAQARLRTLRNRIRNELGVEPWENICMIKPIVEAGLRIASEGGLRTLEQWESIPEVEGRLQMHRWKMGEQLAAYGEEMMAIYRRVECA
ncbi:MAG: hypothetical protein F4Y01_14525 [Gammaproteobacteria bacterium]|nr:hypothetical protein [Gammaproteobacteria bacterium]